MIKITDLKLNPNNPRVKKDDKFAKLVESLKSFPEMMEKRPMVLVTDETGKMYPIGGNMRLQALKELGYKEIPETWITLADDWTEEQRDEFTIKDNLTYGDWDWEQLSTWDVAALEEWGMKVWQEAPEVDYSILDEEDVNEQLNQMTNGVKKAIQIEFEAEHYEEAYTLVKFWREREKYVGGMIMEYLKAEKEKL